MIVRSFIALICLCATAAGAQSIHAPAHVVAGDPVPVRIDGLPARAVVDVAVERTGTRHLSAQARFRADRSGTIDLKRDAPLSGDYAGRDRAGLFWSMRPLADDANSPGAPNAITLSARIGDRMVAQTTIDVLASEPGVTETSIDGFTGARLFRPGEASQKRLPVAILLGGSEGGDGFGKDMVPYVTRLGYAALVFPYYAPSWVTDPALAGLPTSFADIPIDRLGGVRDWIAGQPDLDPKRIVVIGVSKGGEFAMLAAAHYPWLRGVVGVVPSDVVWEGWGPAITGGDTRSSFSWQGKPLPWVPYSGMQAWLASLQQGKATPLADVHARGRATHPDRVPGARIPVEDYAGPMLVVGGGEDQTWPSAEMVRNIAARRRTAGRPTEVLLFPAGGHGLSGSGWSPMRREDPAYEANAHAQIVFRDRLTRFLEQTR